MESFVEVLKIVVALIGLFYVAPYMVHRAWIQADNDMTKHKKVCDVCLRNIAMVNSRLITEEGKRKKGKEAYDEHNHSSE